MVAAIAVVAALLVVAWLWDMRSKAIAEERRVEKAAHFRETEEAEARYHVEAQRLEREAMAAKAAYDAVVVKLENCHVLVAGLFRDVQIQGDGVFVGEPEADTLVTQHEWAERLRAIVRYLDARGLVKAQEIIRAPNCNVGSFRG